MTDKEFKRLSRPQLIDIIYQLQVRLEELEAENQRLETALEDKRLRVYQAVNIADAALEIHNVMRSAQDAALRYMEEAEKIHEKAEMEYQEITGRARDEAAMSWMRRETVHAFARLLQIKQSL